MSVSLASLWLPILLSGVFVWIASAFIHMVLKYHNSDYKQLNQEHEVAKALRQSADNPGLYSTPYCSDMKEMNDPAVQQRFKDGPVVMMTVMNKGMPPMGKLLGQQLLFFIFGSILIAYIGTMALQPSEDSIHVFHVLFVTAFSVYAWASVPYSIWFGYPWSVTVKYFIDAGIFAVVIGITFAWLWPTI